MQLHGSLDTFVIGFQPDGLFRLFGVPTNELTDCDLEAHSVLGSTITRVAEQLGNSTCFSERVRIVEQALVPRALRCSSTDAISAAVSAISAARGSAGIPVLASNAGISVRQFERRFLQQVGIRPKLFARIARFEAALEHKVRFSLRPWSEVAHEFGYYDQMHMVHDFADFTGVTPSETLNQLEAVYVEQIKSLREQKPASTAEDPVRLVF
ncbi:helix-turn-helix domain-containing protein [Granulicella sibirica]|uniref:helix-turn-helix domain-containing protein n=1 Tax=Granulicella sibirica TaxID=2479048 RepID=UPI001008A316|nr:helix-turn-helix domain-containing protein [Granulicella sibirica]